MLKQIFHYTKSHKLFIITLAIEKQIKIFYHKNTKKCKKVEWTRSVDPSHKYGPSRSRSKTHSIRDTSAFAIL